MFPRIVIVFAALAAVSIWPFAARAQSAPLTAARAPHPLPLDPALGDAAWAAGRLPGPTKYYNITRHAPAVDDTIAAVLYDDQNVYVSFHCVQSDAPIVATQQTNGVGLGLDDFVGITIDTSGNASQVYFFMVTPRGVRYQQSTDNARYNPAWTAAGATVEGGWNAVMIIPLAALRYTGGAQRWRINAIRSESAHNEHFTWTYNGLMYDGPVGTQWPAPLDARFWPAWAGLKLAGKRVSHNPAIDAYGLGSLGGDRKAFVAPNGTLEHLSPRPLGVDFTYPITSTVNLVATLNPDFSNVEIDQLIISPQEFPRQLTEYRPFFAHGASFVAPNPYPLGSQNSPPDLVFYTPNIGPFDRGAKIEGTNGNESFGLMSFRGYDSINLSEFDDVAYGYKHQLPDRSFIAWADGVSAHHSNTGSDLTTEFGVSGRNLHTGVIWMVNESFEHSSTVAGTSHDFSSFVDVHKPNYEVNVTYRDVSPYYAPIDGFVPVADLHGLGGYVNFYGAAPGFKSGNLTSGFDRYFDGSGAVREIDTYVSLNQTLKNGFSIDNFGPATGILRQYDVPAGPGCAGPTLYTTTYAGAPCYRNGQNVRFDLFGGGIGYREGTSKPTTFNYTEGPFGSAYLHQFGVTTSRPLFDRYSIALEYDGTYERSFAGGSLDSQWLRRITFGATLGKDENLTLSLRAINGTGGFALPGVNVAATYHKRFRGGDDLYINIGTPAATQTLDRLIVKYVFHLGARIE